MPIRVRPYFADSLRSYDIPMGSAREFESGLELTHDIELEEKQLADAIDKERAPAMNDGALP